MTNALKLYTFKLCPFAHRVRLALAEKGVLAEHIEIDLRNKPAEFLAISPYGRVPLLVHDDLKVWESAIILEYLDEAFPGLALMPTAPAERATVRMWIESANSRLFATTHRLIFAQDVAQRSTLIEQLRTDVKLLEASLMQRQPRIGPYLLGNKFTLADIALYPWFEQLPTLQKFSAVIMPEECSNVRTWLAAVAARPAVRKCSRNDDWYENEYRAYLAA